MVGEITRRGHWRRRSRPKEKMVTVSLRIPESMAKALEKAAVKRSKKMKSAWCRTDEIRERLQRSFAAADPATLTAVGELLGKHLNESVALYEKAAKERGD